MASNGEESEFFYGIKNNASIANTTPTLIVTKNVDGTYEHASTQDVPLSSASIDALALKANDNEVVKLTGAQTLTNATKTFTTTVNSPAVIVNNSASAYGISFNNTSAGSAIFIQNTFSGNGVFCSNSSTANGIVSNVISGGSGFNFIGKNAGSNTFTVDKLGVVTSSSLAGTGDRSALITANGTITAGLAVPKVYNALLSQSALNAPTAAIISNTLGGVPAWSYTSPGQYKLTLLGTFTSGKTLVFATIGANTAAGDTSIKCFLNTSTGEIILNTTFNAAFTDILLTNASFKIEVYP